MVSILVETPSGYALLRLDKDSLVSASEAEIGKCFESASKAKKSASLQSFKAFTDVKQATKEIAALQEGRVGGVLKSLIKKKIIKPGLAKEGLAVWDKQLAQTLKKDFNIEVLVSPAINEIFRGVKTHIESLISDLSKEDNQIMNVSLAHSLSRFRLKFSPEKVDVMVIQAVGLLDDLDKELNNLAMKLKEWYGFHFPELLKLVTDNVVFAKLVKKIKYRHAVQTIQSFAELVDSGLEHQIRQAAETSMGSDVVDADLANMLELCDRVLELSQYRVSLTEYLRTRMVAIAPNLTFLVGELVAARLLAQAGSLMNLAKHASSTVQILGAEKALFRALKAKANTPKYGLIYHAHLVGQAAPKLKGKISRILAAKLSICTRVDAFKDCALPNEASVAIGAKAYVERRLEELSQAGMSREFGSNATPVTAKMQKYVPARMRPETTTTTHVSDEEQQGLPEVKIQPAIKKEKSKRSREEKEASKAAKEKKRKLAE